MPSSSRTGAAAASSASGGRLAARPSRHPKSVLVVLRLSSDILNTFAARDAARKSSRAKSTLSSTTTTTTAATPITTTPTTPTDNSAQCVVGKPVERQTASDTDAASALDGSTPTIDGNSHAPAPSGAKTKKPAAVVKRGTKRSAGPLSSDGPLTARTKPGPKKKPRLADSSQGATTGVAGVSTQKLGPKANQGAINAGLRALDRSGKPCRKWEKKILCLKSFTGTSWSLPTWRTPKKPTLDENGDIKSDTTGSSEPAKVNGSSAIPSDKSSSGGIVDALNGTQTPARPASLPAAGTTTAV